LAVISAGGGRQRFRRSATPGAVEIFKKQGGFSLKPSRARFLLTAVAMTAPRPILANRFYMVSRRCNQRKFLLRPDDLTNRIFLYALAIAAGRFNIEIIAVVAMSNHYHAIVYDPDATLPRFLETFHALTARALNRRRGRRENFWSAEQPNVNYLVELNDVIEKTVYTLTNPVQAHLVDKALNWPGVSSTAWLDGRSITVAKPRVFFSKKGSLPAKATVRLSTPRGYDGAMSDWASLVRERVAEAESSAATERLEKRIPVLGRKRVLVTSPNDRAESRERRGGLKPFISAKNHALRLQAIEALKEFRRLYYKARDAFRAGQRKVLFPIGTFALVHRCGVSLSAP
jgi:REP element-mobilizing transposase RayT